MDASNSCPTEAHKFYQISGNKTFYHWWLDGKQPPRHQLHTCGTSRWQKKMLLCKVECPKLHHCLQRAVYYPRQMLAFKSASRTYWYRRLGQSFSGPRLQHHEKLSRARKKPTNVVCWWCFDLFAKVLGKMVKTISEGSFWSKNGLLPRIYQYLNRSSTTVTQN